MNSVPLSLPIIPDMSSSPSACRAGGVPRHLALSNEVLSLTGSGEAVTRPQATPNLLSPLPTLDIFRSMRPEERSTLSDYFLCTQTAYGDHHEKEQLEQADTLLRSALKIEDERHEVDHPARVAKMYQLASVLICDFSSHQLDRMNQLVVAATTVDQQYMEPDYHQDQEQTCPICLDSMKKHQALTTTCQSGCHHVIHSECWRQYMMSVPNKQRSCPMCRNKDTRWPDDELTRIAFMYADPVEDIMEKGPTWWLGLTQQHLNLHYFQEDETQEEFTSRMEESLQEALEQGATDPEPDSDDEDMPSLISDEDYQIGQDDEISPVTVHDHFTVLEPLTDEEEEQQDEDQVLENDARLARAREAAQRIDREFYQDQRRRHQVIAEDLAADMAAEDAIEALETEFRNNLERQLLQEFELENPPHTHPQQQNMDQMPEAAQLLFYNALCSNSREADSNNDDASLGATHPDDNIELGEDLLDLLELD